MNNMTEITNNNHVDEIYEEMKGNEKLDYDNIYEMFDDCKRTLRRLRIPIASDDKISFKVVDEIWAHGKKCDDVPAIRKTNFEERSYEIEFDRRFADFSNPLLDYLYVKATLYHELLHTCRGCEWHYAPFRKYSKKIYEREGIRANLVTVDGSIFRTDLPISYVGECSECHYIVYGRKQEEVDYLLEETTMEQFKDGVPSRCPCCGGVYYLTYIREPEE